MMAALGRSGPLVALILLAFPLAALAQGEAKPAESPKPWRRGELLIGAYVADFQSGVEIKSDSGVGVSVDPEELLGMDQSLQRFQIQASFLLGDRHRLSLDYVDVSRESSRDLATRTEIGDVVFPEGTHVDTQFDLRFISLIYGYSILQDDRMDIALTFGIHGMLTKFAVEATTLGEAESEQFLLPIPLPGIRAQFALTPTLFLRQELEILYVPLPNFQGFDAEVTFALEWTPLDHLGFGLGYNAMRLWLNMDDQNMPSVDFKGRFEVTLTGLMLYTIFYF